VSDGTDDSGDDETGDADWLAGQFTPTEQVPRQPDPGATTAQKVPPVAPRVSVPPAQSTTPPRLVPPASAAPVAPVASAPAPNADGGFTWGLRPRSAADVPAPVGPPEPTPPSPPTPPVLIEDVPTQPLSWDEFAATQQSPTPRASAPADEGQPTAVDQPTEQYTVQPWQPAPRPDPPTSPFAEDRADAPGDPTSALDSLFAEHQFQPYEEVGVLGAVQAPAPVADDFLPPDRPPRAPLTTTQKFLMGVAGGLIAVLILIAMFFVGERIGSASAATPATSSTSGSTTVPKPAGTGGPAAPGNQLWSALQGGECIQSFSSAWAVTFAVVGCSANHDAEMVFKGTLPDAADTSYPSNTEFQTEITPLCSAPTAINYSAAAAVTDLQVSFSYPPSASKWIAGDRTYYCFVDRQSGGNLPGDLSVPKQ
jgi:Septum formation